MSTRVLLPRSPLVSCTVAVALLTLFPPAVAGQLTAAREYEIKAGLLVKFAKFVDWPDDAFASKRDNLRLEVVGHDPFDGALDRLVAGKLIDHHPIVIVYRSDLSNGPHGHMVFISASEGKRWPALLTALDRASALTVSDIDRFAQNGGVIGLVMNGQSVNFVINKSAARKARLSLSSQLLSVASLVN